MIRANAPIATPEDRSAISWIVARIRPEWDRKGIESALAKHPDQTLDLLAMQAINAAVTRVDQRSPACLGLDGEHTNRARVALTRPVVTAAPPTSSARGLDCAICGVPEGNHGPANWLTRLNLDGESIEQHDHQPASTTTSTPDIIARAKSAALSSKEQQ